MRGMLGIILDEQGLAAALPTCAVLRRFAVLFVPLTAVRFNVRETKVSET